MLEADRRVAWMMKEERVLRSEGSGLKRAVGGNAGGGSAKGSGLEKQVSPGREGRAMISFVMIARRGNLLKLLLCKPQTAFPI